VIRDYFVYMMTNNSGRLYVGMTNDLTRRVAEHKAGQGGTFTSKYKMTRLVWYESTSDVRVAIEREKQVKDWNRKKKFALITAMNPRWRDLAEADLPPESQACHLERSAAE